VILALFPNLEIDTMLIPRSLIGCFTILGSALTIITLISYLF